MKLKYIKIFLKKIIKTLVIFIVSSMIFCAVGVYAATVINFKDVLYSNTNSGLSSTNVQSAIDEVTELKKEYIGQIQTYMNYIDKNIRKITKDKTIGIIIVRKENKFIMEYCNNDKISEAQYELI